MDVVGGSCEHIDVSGAWQYEECGAPAEYVVRFPDSGEPDLDVFRLCAGHAVEWTVEASEDRMTWATVEGDPVSIWIAPVRHRWTSLVVTSIGEWESAPRATAEA
jgi:hypothetical protein